MKDAVPGRPGEWMQTSTGLRFFPLDPRERDICIADIANGLAMTCRYAGQINIDLFYSVAEHSVLIARYAHDTLRWPPKACLAALLHDASEAYLGDLTRAAKAAAGLGYRHVEAGVSRAIFSRYNCFKAFLDFQHKIKELDQRIIPTEKKMLVPLKVLPWAHDKLKPLPVTIECWGPRRAKGEFLQTYDQFIELAGEITEPWEM